MIREHIQIVHCHQAFSSISHEAILHAKTMGLKVIFTDHSLFGFQDTSSILTNKLLKFSLSDINHVICVSHTSKENTVLRASLIPDKVSVIPNAVIASEFTPDPSQRLDSLTIVVASRLVYRKGTDLLVAAIPLICKLFPSVNFLIGFQFINLVGDGNKRIDLEQMREVHILQDRVTLLGALPHEKIRDTLVKGHIFLNTSLTEAFCIAIVEAASCGLLVVSTKVGGVPEVLPEEMIIFSEPNQHDLVSALSKAIHLVKSNSLDHPNEMHKEVSQMYSWKNVAERTQKVYKKVQLMKDTSFQTRLLKYNQSGIFAGIIAMMIVVVDWIVLVFLEWAYPRDNIDLAPKFEIDYFREYCEELKTQ